MRFTNQYKTHRIQDKQEFVCRIKYNRYEFHMVLRNWTQFAKPDSFKKYKLYRIYFLYTRQKSMSS